MQIELLTYKSNNCLRIQFVIMNLKLRSLPTTSHDDNELYRVCYTFLTIKKIASVLEELDLTPFQSKHNHQTAFAPKRIFLAEHLHQPWRTWRTWNETSKATGADFVSVCCGFFFSSKTSTAVYLHSLNLEYASCECFDSGLWCYLCVLWLVFCVQIILCLETWKNVKWKSSSG